MNMAFREREKISVIDVKLTSQQWETVGAFKTAETGGNLWRLTNAIT